MAAGLLGRLDHPFHRRIQLIETYFIGNGVPEQIHTLEHEAEIPQKAVHAVVLHVHAAQLYATLVHIPETGDQMAKGGLASAVGTDDCGSGFLRDMDRNT